MAENTVSVNTRIRIRNDELSNWEGSQIKLLKGELALGRRPDGDDDGAGTYELRIGVGNKTWDELDPGNFAISADQVIGLNGTIASLSTTHYETADLDMLSDYDTYNNGDTAVVKTLIAGEGDNAKYSYTAYVWNSDLTGDDKWAAMDGNYDASNVYIGKDVSCLGSYTAVGNINKNEVIPSGKSVQQILDQIFTKKMPGTTTFPSVSINTATVPTAKRVEYGTAQTPAYSFTFNHGSYQYGPPVGTEVSSWNVWTNGNALTGFDTISTDTVNNTNNTSCNPSAITATFNSTTTLLSNIYQISAKVGYTAASAVPHNNDGSDDTTSSNFISSGTKSTSGYLYSVYRPRYVKMTNSFEEPPTSFNAADFTNAPILSGTAIKLTAFNKWFKINDDQWPTAISVLNNYYNVFFAAPKGIKSNWTAKKSDNVNVLPTSENPSDATMTYLNGDNGTYSVYQINNATPYDDNKCNITWVS